MLLHSSRKEAIPQLKTASLEIISSLFWARRPFDHDMFHSLGRHDAPAGAAYTVGKQPTEVGSGDDVLAALPGEHVKRVVLVALP